MRRLLGAAVLLALLAAPATAVSSGHPRLRPGAEHAVPLHGELLRPYDAPESPYAPGHRGVDVGAEPGAPVRASAPGVVRFAGVVAGNRTVTVDHGEGLWTSSSYLADLAVVEGQPVDRGQVLGTVGDGHPGSGLPPHVHLSARRDSAYFDPLELYVGSSHTDLLSLVG